MFLSSKNINFSYIRSKTVLNGISFALQRGETLAIVGGSGCGKSTLMRVISGILPARKEHTITGLIDIDGQTPEEYRKSGKLSFMFQESALMPNLTVRENIGMPLKIKGLEEEGKLADLLHMVGLANYAHYLPKELSGGMKTRVALARSYITNPELLLLDEPFSALDIAWKRKLYVELGRLREQAGTTTVIVTHDVQEALLLSNRVLVMNPGGRVESSYRIESRNSLMERVEDISGFMKEIYADFFIPIQKTIMQDGTEN